jgi:hypothetical protein
MRFYLAFLLGLIVFGAFGQNRTTSQAGDWNDVNTWGGQTVPDQTLGTFGTITVNHPVTVSAASYNTTTPLQIDQLVINDGGSVTVEAGAALRIQNGTGNDITINGTLGNKLIIEGTLYTASGVAFLGLTTSNTSFATDAELRASSANIPIADGYDGVNVFLENVTAGLTLGTSWSQLTINTDLTINCPALPNTSINFNGIITDVGTLQVVSTNGTVGGRIVLGQPAAATTNTINIGAGGIEVANDSRIYINNGAGTVEVNLDGNFQFSSTSTSYSQLTTGSGIGTINFNNGDFNMSQGLWRFVGGGSDGVGNFNFNNSGNLVITGGTISENGGGTARGIVSFLGNGTDQNLNVAPTSIGTGTINLVVNNSSGSLTLLNNFTCTTLDLTNGTLSLNGSTLTVNGAITQTSGIIDATSSSGLVISGTGAVPSPLIVADNSVFNLLTFNRSATTLSLQNETASSDITVTTLNLTAGTLEKNAGTLSISNNGSITRSAGTLTLGSAIVPLGVYDLTYTNTAAVTTGPELTTSSTALRNFTKQSGTGTVNLNSNVVVNGNLSITSGTVAASTFNVAVGGNMTANANFTQSSPATFTFATNSPTHSLTGTAATVTFGALTINGALTISRSATIGGNLDILASSSFTATSGTIAFSGNPSIITNNGGSNVVFSALNINTGATLTAPLNGTISIAGNFSGNGTLTANGGTVIFNGTTTYSGSPSETLNNVIISTGATFSGAQGLNITGTLVNDGSISLTNGTLTFNPAGASTTFSGSGTNSLNNLTVSASKTLDYTSTSPLTVLNNITLTGNFNDPNGTADITIGNDINGSGNLIHPNGRIIFTGAGADLQGATTSVRTFGTLRVTGTLTVAAAVSYSINNGSLDVTGTLTTGLGTSVVTFNGTCSILSTGTSTTINGLLIASGATLNATGTLNLNSSFTNNGTFNHGNGTIAFTSNGNTKNINSTNTLTFYNLVVGDNANAVRDVSNETTAGLNLAGVLTVQAGAIFDADGAAAPTKSFVLLSSSDSPANDASIGPLLSGAQVSGSFTVQRYISLESVNRMWRYIASPVIGATVSDWQDDFFVTGSFVGAHNGSSPGCTGCLTNPSSYYYNSTTQAYVAYPTPSTGSNSDPLVNGRGYSVFLRQNLDGDINIDYTGTYPTSPALTVATAADNVATTTVEGYSLVGNPYPSPIVWSTTGFTKSGSISDVIAVRDNVAGTFQYYNINDGTGVIATGQSFWVQTIADDPSASLLINEQAKTSTQASTTTFYRIAQNTENAVRIKLTKSTNNITHNIFDVATLKIVSGALSGLDNRDAIRTLDNKLESNITLQVQDISIMSADSKKMAINAVPEISKGQIFPLLIENMINPAYTGVPAETNVSYTLQLESSGSLTGVQWVLHDKFEDKDIALENDGSYTFTVTSDVSSQASDRFTLLAESSPLTTSLEVTGSEYVCEGSAGFVLVKNSQANLTYGLEINGNLHASLEHGTGQDLSIEVDSEWLSPGSNTIKVYVNSGIEQAYLSDVVQLTYSPTSSVTATNASLCHPGSVKLQASGAPEGTIYKWYSSVNASAAIGEGSVFETPELQDTTTFYVAAVNSQGCEGQRVAVVANVGDSGRNPQVVGNAQAVCVGTSARLEATGSDEDTYRWYASETASEPLIANAVFETPALTTEKTYYVASVSSSGCESKRIPVTVNVKSYSPKMGLTQLNSICKEGKTFVEASGSNDIVEYYWYENSTASSHLAVGNQFETPVLSSNREYFVAAMNADGCMSIRSKFLVEVRSSDPSSALQASSAEACAGDLVNLTVTGSARDYKWYPSLNDKASIFEGSSLSFSIEDKKQTYFVSAVDESGCEGSRKEIAASPIVIEPAEIAVVSDSELEANYEIGIQWYHNGEPLQDATLPTLSVTEDGLYGLMVTSKGCQSYAERSVTITGLEEELGKSVHVYPVPANDNLTIENRGTHQVRISIIDAAGKQLDRIEVSKDEKRKFNVEQFTSGIYYLKIQSKSLAVYKKLIIE